MKYEPKNDGIDHINAYSKGATELGKLLTNFAHTPFEHPIRGKFASVEAAWYYAKSGFMLEEIRGKHGYEAKKFGKRKTLREVNEDQELPRMFVDFIKECIKYKLRQNLSIMNELVKTDLPIAHYYYYGDKDKNPRVIELSKHSWQIEYIEELRLKAKKYLKKKNKDQLSQEDFGLGFKKKEIKTQPSKRKMKF